ncbi:MAG: hypothetical protein IJI60_03040 [Bacilli bacterium]|nr:hypothetical protein [Bacilli bacterium]
MENNINALNELNKGCSMGIQALKFIIPKTKEKNFRTLLKNQLLEYESLSNKINELYQEYSTNEIEKTTLMEKAMTWYGIQMDTFLDSSVTKLADLLIQGTNMGIIEGKKILNHKTLDKKVHKICSEYISMQESYLKKLKEFL